MPGVESVIDQPDPIMNEDAPSEPDSDFDESDDYYEEMGYTALGDGDDDDDEGDAEDNPETNQETEAIPAPPIIEVKSDELIAPADLDAIKLVMSGFSIPETAIPDWAKAIPEEQWLPKVQVLAESDERKQESEASDKE